MNNHFYNNSLLSKLCAILDELTETEDRDVIEKLIRKQMPKQTKYNFSLDELSSVSQQDASHHSRAIRKSQSFAAEYIYSLYKIDLSFRWFLKLANDDDDILQTLIDEKWSYILQKLINDFQTTRYLIYKTTPIEIRTDTIESFDLYVTNLFIEEYQKIVKEYQLLKTKTKTK